MLLLSKLESQSISRRELYSLDEQIRQTVLDYEPRWEEKNLEPDLELDSVTYFGDEEILSHVWSNLIDNAIKYSESGGRIILRMTERAGVIFVTVEDEGPGSRRRPRNGSLRNFTRRTVRTEAMETV